MVAHEYDFDENGIPRRRKGGVNPAEAAEKRKAARKGGNAPKAKVNKQSKRSSRTVVNDKSSGQDITVYHEKMPNGGTITMLNPEEVAYYREMRSKYEKEYAGLLTKPNDINRLSQLLSFELTAHRYTQRMVGSVTQYNDAGEVVGIELVDALEMASISQTLPKVQEEIRKLEQALKIDKRTREGSSEGDIKNYMESLKRAAIQYKVHLSERYTAFDEFVNELKWRMRVLANPDEEDRKYHGVETAEKLCVWIEGQLNDLTEIDKKFANDKQSLWTGTV